MNIPDGLLEALAADSDKKYQTVGIEIGKLYTNHGLPIDLALERLDLSKSQKIAVLAGAQNWLIEHRRNSDATDKALDRQRASNREAMERFIKTGETGVY